MRFPLQSREATLCPILPISAASLSQMRERFYSAVVCDALDALGFPRQSPRVPLRPLTTQGVLIGRAKTTLWAEMAHPDPRPYELELKAVDTCQPDDVLIAAAGGSMRSGLVGRAVEHSRPPRRLCGGDCRWGRARRGQNDRDGFSRLGPRHESLRQQGSQPRDRSRRASRNRRRADSRRAIW